MRPLLMQAGLTDEQVNDRQARIKVRSQIKLLELVAEAVQDDCLGFHLARDFDLREIGLLYYAMASSDVLGDSIRRAERYSGIVNEGIIAELHAGREAAVTVRYVGVERRHERHQIEFWLTAFVRVCRQLTGHRLVPDRVRFIHQRGGNIGELRSFFGGSVEYGADVDEVVFPGAALRLQNVGADPFLNEIVTRSFEDTLADRAAGRGSLRPDLENVIAPLLPHGKASAGEAARKLGMSQRTLARRLRSEKLTFSGVTDELKKELARCHLRDESLSISQVAWLVGFRDVSAFTHAFKRWTGMTPREARERTHAAPRERSLRAVRR